MVGYHGEQGRRASAQAALFLVDNEADQRAWPCRSRSPRGSLRSPVIKASALPVPRGSAYVHHRGFPERRAAVGRERPAGRAELAEPARGGRGAPAPSRN